MTYREEDTEPPFIEVFERQDLLSSVAELGFCQKNSMGDLDPLTWTEIRSYEQSLKLGWTPADYRTVVMLSRAYVRGRIESTDLFSIAPSDREMYQ